jgi:hypothetical protein
MTLTGNATVDALIVTAESARQTAVSVASTQAGANTATVTFYRAVLAAKLAASPAFDVGAEIFAVQDQLNSSV